MKLNFASLPKFYISLKRSYHRRAMLMEEFSKHNIVARMWPATDKRDVVVPEMSDKQRDSHASGIFACMTSHIALLRYAQQLNYDAICIFEDDAVFCDDFGERISYIESLDIDFDIFCLGGHFHPDAYTVVGTQWNHIHKIPSMGGTYGYIITKIAYEFVLRNITYQYGMDQFMSDHLYKRFRSYAFVPFLVGCRPCVSEITGANHEYHNISWFYKQAAIANIKDPSAFAPAITMPVTPANAWSGPNAREEHDRKREAYLRQERGNF